MLTQQAIERDRLPLTDQRRPQRARLASLELLVSG